MVSNKSEFAEWLRQYMAVEALRPAHVAVRADVSETTVWQWLRGRGPLHPAHVKNVLLQAAQGGPMGAELNQVQERVSAIWQRYGRSSSQWEDLKQLVDELVDAALAGDEVEQNAKPARRESGKPQGSSATRTNRRERESSEDGHVDLQRRAAGRR